MKYPGSSQSIPNNVLQAIKFTGRTGLMSKQIWEKRFSSGCATWKITQFSKLLKKDFLKPYMKIGKDQFYKLGLTGKIYAMQLGIKTVAAPLSNQILHDAWIFESIIALDAKGYILEWISEAMLKSGCLFNEERWYHQKKIPDVLLKVNIQNDVRLLAFEYERTLKASWRIKETLRTYSGLLQIPLVIFICENEVIRQAYLNTLAKLNDRNLNKKIGFALSNGWHSNSESQPIQMLDRTFQLKDILQIVS